MSALNTYKIDVHFTPGQTLQIFIMKRRPSMHAPLIVTKTKLLSMLFCKAFYNDQVLASLFHLLLEYNGTILALKSKESYDDSHFSYVII